MLFCSAKYFCFFTIVFLAYWTIQLGRVRIWLLLLASFYFYASWNKWLAGLITLSTTADYLIARVMDQTNKPSLRRCLVTASVVGNLSLLVYFKYAGFFLTSLESLANQAGLGLWIPSLRVILPVGISFYTFEAINYSLDVYAKRIPAERRLDHLMLFILFFPHLVAGPIVRARDFLPQIGRRKYWSWLRVQLGVHYVLMGMFKKLAIADRMALFADPVFAHPGQYSTHAVWMGVIAYTIQIYCDFSGYSDIALGCAHLLGYKLGPNFSLPYLACNVSEFWHRWHISLSTWLRDYLFIPLGGSRLGSRRTALNLMTVMILGGLWHGANWTFVVWGAFHGLLLIGHRCFRELCKLSTRLTTMVESSPGSVLRVLLTLACVAVGWVFFRATSFHSACTILTRLVIYNDGLGSVQASQVLWLMLGLIISCHLFIGMSGWNWVVKKIPSPMLGFGYGGVVALSLVLAPGLGSTFIYFQF